jgi:hypothetical protein
VGKDLCEKEERKKKPSKKYKGARGIRGTSSSGGGTKTNRNGDRQNIVRK